MMRVQQRHAVCQQNGVPVTGESWEDRASFIILHQHFNTHRPKKKATLGLKHFFNVTDINSRLFSGSPNALMILNNQGSLTSVVFSSFWSKL